MRHNGIPQPPSNTFIGTTTNGRVAFQRTHAAIWLINKSCRVAYDDKDTFKQKIEWGNGKGLGGVLIWSINDDDQTSGGSSGGSHWSLALVSLVDGVAFYYDSIGRTNFEEAGRIIQKLATVLKMRLRFIPLNDTPQQDNGSDCGVYVCMFMEHLLLQRLLMVRTNEKVSMSLGGKSIDAREGRKKMLRVIEERRREGERRRS